MTAEEKSAEEQEARENRRACGYQFVSAEAALGYLAEANATWRNPEWCARDRQEKIDIELAGMFSLSE